MIALTFDTDWVQEETLVELCKNLSNNHLKATFFVTREYKYLKNPLFEINPHINFNSHYSDYKKEFLKIGKTIHKKTKGIRNHSLYFHERLREIWRQSGIKYSINQLLPLVEDLKPFYISKSVLELPLYFLDYWYLENNQKPKFDINDLKLGKPGLKIFDFHPIHLSLNTPSLNYYQKFRHFYHKPKMIKKYSFKGRGIGSLFFDFVEYIKIKNLKTYQLQDIYKKYK